MSFFITDIDPEDGYFNRNPERFIGMKIEDRDIKEIWKDGTFAVGIGIPPYYTYYFYKVRLTYIEEY